MNTFLCSCLVARVDIYTVKRLANEEWLCHLNFLGNKADHSIFLSPFLSVFSFVFSLFYSLIAPLHLHPSFTAVFHSLIAHCLHGINEVLVLQMHQTPSPSASPPYPQCFAAVGDVHLTISNELTCVRHCRCCCCCLW